MSFGEAIRTCWSKYADFSGRARRSEFWWFYLFVQLVSLPLVIGVYIATFAAFIPVFSQTRPDGTIPDSAIEDISWPLIAIVGLVMLAVQLVLTIPFLSASARRLHDTGQTAHWLWLHLASLGIVPLIMCVLEDQPHANQYGPDPKEHERTASGYGAQHGAAGPVQPFPPAPLA